MDVCVKCLGLISSRNFLRSDLFGPWIVRCQLLFLRKPGSVRIKEDNLAAMPQSNYQRNICVALLAVFICF
ncbi:hypothetical protein BDV41DRAFT_543402 [Aspergillus transmontanensis]|uniref:Uncharacterized protein n=1 Tax=Aspergillus transmontanensis TaxID=1034304 RepID=A0A5N6VVD0_9EURO|nr:hypothetical protein BDV41DRAFT_543402 [Aspergillus transmontanensis]